jgi:PIN domain nuclease of toxin-antitoxin system
MRLLLDTHIWLWSFGEPHKLTSLIHQALADPGNTIFLSPISLWEVQVLVEKKKIAVHEDLAVWFARSIQDLELEEAALTWKAVNEIRSILPHHKDPADRFLAATAIAHDLILVTADRELAKVPGLKVLANI